MRMPWQRQRGRPVASAEPHGPDDSATERRRQDPGPRAWRSLPAMRGTAGVDAPLTARSAELAETLARRMRATGTRPGLVHRPGLPDPAAPGTVRGLATVTPGGLSAVSSHQAVGFEARPDPDAEAPGAASTGAPSATRPRVAASRSRERRLTAVDAALAASLYEAMQPAEAAPRVEEAAIPLALDLDPAPASGVPQRSPRTVVRKRPGGVRPRGLQAPLPSDSETEASTAADDRAAEVRVARATEQPSRAVAAAVGRLHRADVHDVPVWRGDDAGRLAAAANARGATRGGEVFIPASEGSLESGRAGGLLAHELTHVIQQRRLGTAVPLEHSPAGRRLEAEAVMTERHVRGDLGAPAPPVAADPPAPAPETPATGQSDDAAAAIARDIQDELVASGRALRMPDGALVFPGAGAHLPEQPRGPVQPGMPVQHAGADDAVPPEPAVAPIEPAGTPGPGSAPAFEQPPSPSPAPVAAAASSAAVAPAPWEVATPAAAPEPVPVPYPDWSVAPDAGTATVQTRAVPEVDLDDLARRVYGRVRTHLRSELLIDRERAGLLTDFR